jgi:hypothetical protein
MKRSDCDIEHSAARPGRTMFAWQQGPQGVAGRTAADVS